MIGSEPRSNYWDLNSNNRGKRYDQTCLVALTDLSVTAAVKKVKPSASDASASGPTFNCSVCNRQFGQMSHVQQHMRLHTGLYNV